jgi:hypothetical protein
MEVRLLLIALASAAALGASTAASAQVVDLPDTPTVPVLPDLPDVPLLPDVPDATDMPVVSGVTGTQSQPGTAQSGGSSGRSSGSARNPRVRTGSNGTHTRFDRLPPRYERLVERILAGRDVDANLRRLERLLAAAPPRLRARILRLVRLEIRALEQGRTTAEERRRIKRLHRIEDLFASPAAAGAGTPVSAVASPAGEASAGDTSGSPSGVSAVSAAGTSESRNGAGPSASAGSRNGILGLPSRPDAITLGTFVLVLGAMLLAAAVGAFALAALPSRAVPVGVRQQLSRSDLATLGFSALAATMLLLLVAALF